MRSVTPWQAEGVRILSDGKPKSLESLKRAMARMVPPPVAVRTWESKSSYNRSRIGLDGPSPTVPVSDQILSGSRRKVGIAIQNLKRNGKIDIDGDTVTLSRKS